MKNTKIVKRLLALLVLSMTYGTASGQKIVVQEGIWKNDFQTHNVCGGSEIHLTVELTEDNVSNGIQIGCWDLDNPPLGVTLEYTGISSYEQDNNTVRNLPNLQSVTVKVQLLQSDGNEWKWISQNVANIKPAEINFDGSDLTTCDGTANLKTNEQGTLFKYKWSAQGSGTISNSSIQNTSIINISAGSSATVSLKVFKAAFEEYCSQEKSITITNNQVQLGTFPVEDKKDTICTDFYAVFADDPTDLNGSGARGFWSAPEHSPITFDNSTVCNTYVRNIPSNSNWQIKWTVKKGGCEAERSFELTSYKVASPNAGADQIVFDNQTILDAQNIEHGYVSGLWSLSPSNSADPEYSLIAFYPTMNNTVVSNLPQNKPVTFRWTVYNKKCSKYDDVDIKYVKPVITAPSEVCGDKVEVSVTVPPKGYTGEWSCATNGVSFLNANSCTTTVRGLPNDSKVTLQWNLYDNNGTMVSTANHEITNIKVGDAEIISNSNTTCDNDFALTAKKVYGSYKGLWSTTGNGYFPDPTGKDTHIYNLDPGENEIIWTVYSAAHPECTSSASIVLTNKSVDAKLLNMGSDINTCDDYYQLTAVDPGEGATGEWSSMPKANFDNKNSSSTYVRDLPYGTNTIIWTVSNDDCGTKTTSVLITSHKMTTSATGESTVTVPQVELTADDPCLYSASGYWSVVGDQGDIVFDNKTFHNTYASNLPDGKKVTFRWNLTNTYDCHTYEDVEVTYNAPKITAPTTNCGESAQISIEPTGLYDGFWSANNANVSFSNSAERSTTVFGLPVGQKVTLSWTITDGSGSPLSVLPHEITNNALHPTVPNANITTTNSRTVIVADNPPANAKSYHWEMVSAGERTVIEQSKALETKVRYLKPGVNTFKWYVENDDCDAAAVVNVQNDNLTKSLTESDIDISLSKTSYTYTGSAFEPDVTVKDGTELLEPTNDYTVSYQDNTAVGTAKAVITGVGNYSGVVEKEFAIEPKSATATIELAKSTYTYTGSEIEPSFAVKVGEETIPADNYTVTYTDNLNVGEGSLSVASKTSSNYSFNIENTFTITKAPLTVTAVDTFVVFGKTISKDTVWYEGFVGNDDESVLNGVLQYDFSYHLGDNVGNYTITPKGLTAGNYEITFVPGKLTVNPKEIEGFVVEFALSQLPYTGEALTPALSVSDGCVILVAGTDYTVEYTDNTDPGTATATITGKGNYNGTITKEFTILEPDEPYLSFEPGQQFTYSGSAITPAVVVMLGDNPMSESSYTVTYTDNTYAGTATIKVESREDTDYEFSFDASFTILQAPLTITAKDNAITYGEPSSANGVEISGLVGSEGESVLTGTLQYDYDYTLGDNVGDYTITPKGLTAGNYEITFVPGKLTVNPKAIEGFVVEFALSQLPYTGEALTPALSVSDGGVTLSAGTDYTVEYTDNTAPGTATATITGKGNYKGAITKEFTILEPDEPYLSFEAGQQFTYSGSAIAPAVVVMLGDNPMSESSYTVTYTDNTNAGTATIKVESREDTDYEFSFDASFTILQASITGAQVELTQSPVEYTGSPLTPDFVVTLGEKTLAAGTDYIVEFADNLSVGTATATITGTGNYKGSITKEFEIIKLPATLTITDLPKLQYEVGEVFDFNGGKLLLEYNDGSNEQITFADAAVTGFDSDKIGPQKVTATYQGLSVTLSVSVAEKEKVSNSVPPQENGVYQLSTPEHLFWFITQVNNGNTKIDAVLTQDIVINKDCLNRLSLTKKDNDEFKLIEWQPIGTPDCPYEGTFNGQGHTVSGLYVNSNTEDNVGLFGMVSEEGTVKNVGVVDSYLKGDENVGAVCGSNEGTIVNCYNTSIIQGNDNVGAITGSVTKEAVVANSYSVGKATTTLGEEKGVSGVISENVQNCYYLTEKTDNTDSQARTAVEFKSGEVAKSLVEGAKTLAEDKGNDPTFVLEVFDVAAVLPGVEDIQIPDNPEQPEDPENPNTPVSEVSNSNVRIWSYANTIFVENADEDIYVVSLSGTTIKKASPESSRIEIRITTPGVYIVKTGSISQKVLIK